MRIPKTKGIPKLIVILTTHLASAQGFKTAKGRATVVPRYEIHNYYIRKLLELHNICMYYNISVIEPHLDHRHLNLVSAHPATLLNTYTLPL